MKESPTNELPPARRRIRRRIVMWKWGRITVVVIALAILSFLDRRGYLLAHRDDGQAFHLREARVVRVIDGDTFEVDLPDELSGTPTTRVRIWGIDCPELARAPGANGRGGTAAEPFADVATEFTRNLIDGRTVQLRIESHRIRGAYGRLLAHVDVVLPSDDEAHTRDAPSTDHTNLAEALLEAGLARRDERWVHSMLVLYERVEHRARQRRAGIWQ